jgi:Holliday junction resolvase RusA-like endonuclease
MIILFGVAYSMKNSRRIVTSPRTGKTMMIKSKQAIDAFNSFVLQAKAQWNYREPVPEPVMLRATIIYPSKRFDLDDSMLMDVLQSAGVVKNDRHIWQKKIAKEINPENPRIEFEVGPME